MHKFGFISAALGHALLIVTLPTASHAQPKSIELTGTWIVEGYACEPGVWYKEKIQISVNGNYLVAKKVTGDNCVPAGNITFQGTLPDSVFEGSSFPLTWTIGTPINPASGKTILNLTILNKNSFSVNGTKFNRVTR